MLKEVQGDENKMNWVRDAGRGISQGDKEVNDAERERVGKIN